MSQPDSTNKALATGGAAALLASACCLGPLLLVSVGLSGAWIANLTALEPFRPLFIGIAALALLLAFRRLYRTAALCRSDEPCAAPATRRRQRIVLWVVTALAALAVGFPYMAPWFY